MMTNTKRFDRFIDCKLIVITVLIISVILIALLFILFPWNKVDEVLLQSSFYSTAIILITLLLMDCVAVVFMIFVIKKEREIEIQKERLGITLKMMSEINSDMEKQVRILNELKAKEGITRKEYEFLCGIYENSLSNN